MTFKIVKIPNETLSLTNCIIVNRFDFSLEKCKYIEISFDRNKFIFGIKEGDVDRGELGLSFIQRKWTCVSLQSSVDVKPYTFKKTDYITSVTIDVDFLQKRKTTKEPYDTDKLAVELAERFQSLPFTFNQPVVFDFENKPMLLLVVKKLECSDPSVLTGDKPATGSSEMKTSLMYSNTVILFDKVVDSVVILKGKNKLTSSMPSIINPDWDFTKLGIGGLDKEFTDIFRRAFASRLFPPDVIDDLGMKHVKGILLFGPPGTGKTLMARQIGQMLNSRAPKIVNGPEILNKYVGASEENIRNLFAEAVAEQKKAGMNSGLHMIIFDEIDAICKQRGSMSGSTGVHDTVVNQLLSMIDGVEQLNNILVVGMTNRKDLIDEALLRPGRLEVIMEIGLPSEEGRLQILNIHTANLRQANKIDSDVHLSELATKTKNFSGAEIEGLVRAATTTAMNRLVKTDGKVGIDEKAVENLLVTADDFSLALLNDIKPAFGAHIEDLENYIANGITIWGPSVQDVLNDCGLLIDQAKNGSLISPVSVLLEGRQGSGKTALAAHLATLSKFPFLKICSPENMIGFSEGAKCQAIKKIFDDAFKSELSCIVVDDIERLIEYVPIGPRFSNTVLQTLMVLLKRSLPMRRKLLIIGTTSCRDVLDQMQLVPVFNTEIHMPSITTPAEVIKVMKDLELFEDAELDTIKSGLEHMKICIGIKKLLSLVEMSLQTDISSRAIKFRDSLQMLSY